MSDVLAFWFYTELNSFLCYSFPQTVYSKWIEARCLDLTKQIYCSQIYCRFFPVQPHRTNEVVSFILSWNVLRLSFGGFLLDFHLYVLLPSSQETRPRDSGHLWGLLFIICLSASSFLWRRSGFWTSFVSRYARLSLREITHGHFNVMQMYILGMIHLLKKNSGLKRQTKQNEIWRFFFYILLLNSRWWEIRRLRVPEGRFLQRRTRTHTRSVLSLKWELVHA